MDVGILLPDDDPDAQGAGVGFDSAAGLAVGGGRPLAFLVSSPRAGHPSGLERWSLIRMVRPLSEHFRVHLVNRPPGLPVTTTMAQLAAVYAEAIRAVCPTPVDVLGISTGGSIAQQLAADHPDVVGSWFSRGLRRRWA